MSKIWKMGISPDQFIADTVNLSDDEIGKYFRLLCYARKNEAYLPLDIKRVCNIVKQCDEKSIQYLLETFFIKDEKGYFCKAQKIEFDWVVELENCDGDPETEAAIREETKASIRLIPFDEKPEGISCIYSGKPAKHEVIFAKAY